MSRVYFHSPSGEAELWGGEHHHLHNLVRDAAIAVLDMPNHVGLFRELSPDPYPGLRTDDAFWLKSVETLLRISEPALRWKGREIDSFTLLLNTAMEAADGNPLKLAARIAGQAEVHCWCEGADRAWLARMIDEGLDAGKFRRNTGYSERCGRPSHESWEDVTAFLRSRDDEPVVLSYSVCDGFPNRKAAGWEPPEGTDLRPGWAKDAPGEWEACDYKDDCYGEAKDALWADLGDAECWRTGMEGLRANPGRLRLDPADWDDFGFGFGNGLSAFDLIAPDYADRLDKALLEGK